MARQRRPVRSDIAWSDHERIVIRDHDLCEDLLGRVGLGDFAFLELRHRLPDERESVMINALLVSLAEHGITPNALVSRLTLLGAPESLQGAVAAGLLGLGSTFVGTIEGAARMVQEADEATGWRTEPPALAELAEQMAADFVARRVPVPGIGHPVHRPVDPRAERLFTIAREQGFDDANERLLRAVAAAAERQLGKELPVNVTGAIGAIASELGIPWRVTRGLGVMGRAVGLIGHILEELEQPLAQQVWRDAEHEASAHLIPSTPTSISTENRDR